MSDGCVSGAGYMTIQSRGQCKFSPCRLVPCDTYECSCRYARGFLFPSEAERVQQEIMSDLERWNKAKTLALQTQSEPEGYVEVFGPDGVTPPSWVLSTVTTFHVRYSPPVPDLPLNYTLEALVEGSDMSRLTKSMLKPLVLARMVR